MKEQRLLQLLFSHLERNDFLGKFLFCLQFTQKFR